MTILLEKEVNIKEIQKRFKKIGTICREVKLNNFDMDPNTFYPSDWKIIKRAIRKEEPKDYCDLILISANLMERNQRTANVYTELYYLK